MSGLYDTGICFGWGGGPSWRSGARVAPINAVDACAPSMRQKIDVADIDAKALHVLPATMDGQPALPRVSRMCAR